MKNMFKIGREIESSGVFMWQRKKEGKPCMFCFLLSVSNPWLSVDLEMPFKKWLCGCLLSLLA